MTTYIEDWIETTSFKDLSCSDYSTQSVLKCDSEIDKDLIQFHYNWDIYNSFMKWINNNLTQTEFGLYQSWNLGMTSMFGEQIISSFIDIDELSNWEPYLTPKPIKTFKLYAKIVSIKKGVPRIFPID